MQKAAKICVSAIAASAFVTCALAQAGAPGSPGGTAFSLGKFEEAESLFETAVAADPSNSAALAGLARSRLNNGKEDEAIDLARKALIIVPGNPVAANTLSIAQARKASFLVWNGQSIR